MVASEYHQVKYSEYFWCHIYMIYDDAVETIG